MAQHAKSGDPLEGLETRQDEVLKRLGVLQSRVGQLQEKYSISTCSSSSIPSNSAVVPTDMEKGKFHDIVVYLDPSSIPYSLLVLYEDLRKRFNVLATTHVHSSVLDVPDNLINIFNNGEVKSRKDYQIGLTVIWKKVTNGAVLMVDPYKQSAIEGEVNIARYLQRLLNSQYDSQDIIEATQIDEWLDTAQIQYLDGSNKERAAVLRSLNARFGKNIWLVGDKCSLADITMWSALQQSGQVTDIPANVKKWLTACNSEPGFSSALKLVG
ncbi:aminoacyl tRNA synthase complex-interacting multifunctional protein 2 isoform X3 [Patella vulgata]|uniref:aminoacyl tRNA synthase complex-interacting multifunctional protein 2 isoform X3 n=1 Tax=Patella vulgata TaxID=6465 RepID=UPI00217F9D14|nr:aminoacyl tRNA synthase complex-interacting multifunctional protein 2 isoform X3 [Patella vulgata]